MTFEEWWNESIGYSPYQGIRVIAQEAWNAATQAERERCAKIAESVKFEIHPYQWMDCADAIRDRILNRE